MSLKENVIGLLVTFGPLFHSLSQSTRRRQMPTYANNTVPLHTHTVPVHLGAPQRSPLFRTPTSEFFFCGVRSTILCLSFQARRIFHACFSPFHFNVSNSPFFFFLRGREVGRRCLGGILVATLVQKRKSAERKVHSIGKFARYRLCSKEGPRKLVKFSTEGIQIIIFIPSSSKFLLHLRAHDYGKYTHQVAKPTFF